MLFSMTEEEWDAVIQVHLKGTFAPARFAAVYWREQAKAGKTNDARLINTTSVSGIYGNAGQTNYGAAKAGIAAFTLIASDELARYGVTVNAIAPGALTRLTEDLGILDEERAADATRAGSPRSPRGWRRRSRPASPDGSSSPPAASSPSPRAGTVVRPRPTCPPSPARSPASSSPWSTRPA